jgi:polyferredoxin
VLDNVAWADELILAALIAVGIVFVERRVFCKYLCPIGFLLRITASLPFPVKYRVGRTGYRCVERGLCDKACLMDLKPQQELSEHGYVKNGNCINCMACVSKCPTHAIDLVRIR